MAPPPPGVKATLIFARSTVPPSGDGSLSRPVDGYITSGLLWTPGLAALYVNGREVARWENERVADAAAYLILYNPSGGWDNNQTDDAKLPADFEIDYIRVWQRKDLASDADRNTAQKP